MNASLAIWLRCALLIVLLCCGSPARAAGTILIFGDSLSAGYGLPEGTGWASLLEKRLAADQFDYRVVNASISGETTQGGNQRIAAALQEFSPTVILVALGANDGLRGSPIDTIRRNLIAIVDASRRSGARVILVGMRIPPNYGPVYTRRFQGVFSEVARQQNVSLVPFMLAGFADKREFFQSDGIHPAENAQDKILKNIYKNLRPLLRASQ
ncbi:MAG: arylesterase [Burkholderiales bacterium]